MDADTEAWIDAPQPGPGDGAADFEHLVAPHWSAMHRLAGRLAPPDHRDDLLQDALTAAWRRREKFDPARGTAQAWLLAIVAEHARKRWRVRALPTTELGSDSDSALGTVRDSPDVDLDLDRAIRRLPLRQRLAVTLYYLFDYPVSEVAAVMGCSEGTVKSTLSDARTKLRDHLGDEYR